MKKVIFALLSLTFLAFLFHADVMRLLIFLEERKSIGFIVKFVYVSVWGAIFSFMCFKLARREGFKSWTWALAGFFFNLAAYALLYYLIKRRKSTA